MGFAIGTDTDAWSKVRIRHKGQTGLVSPVVSPPENGHAPSLGKGPGISTLTLEVTRLGTNGSSHDAEEVLEDVNETHPKHLTSLLVQALTALHDLPYPAASLLLTFVFARDEGQVIRCDFIERRFEGCPLVQLAKSFLRPLDQVAVVPPNNTKLEAGNVFDFVSRAVGGLLSVPQATRSHSTYIQQLEVELEWRLSFPWTTNRQLKQRRLFWIQGRENFESIHRAYEAAWALGITLVIVDEPGHWLEDDQGPYAYLREAFIPMSIAPDKDFPKRIVEAVRSYPLEVEGVVTISDVRLPYIAKACEELGFPTEPYASYRMAGDKGTTRLMEDQVPGDFTAVVSSVEELDERIKEHKGEIPYPLIVKPCLGWNSDCVFKVRNLAELRDGVGRASGRHSKAATKWTRAVVEPYIGRPEVDANFILLNGEILYFQLSDDFPSTGDTVAAARSPEGAAAPNFMETIMMLPSGLPEAEQLILRDSLKQSMARQGLHSGVIHCEARVRNSKATYKPRNDNGLVDLDIGEACPDDPSPSCYLHEINVRPPGYFSSMSVMLAHGIDYYAVRMLFGLGQDTESDRIRALSVPFGHPNAGAQYTLGIAVFPGTRTGIMETPDAMEEMMERYPYTRDWLADWQTMRKGGSKVFGPEEDELWYVGYATVASRKGRGECLERVKEVKDCFSYKLVGE